MNRLTSVLLLVIFRVSGFAQAVTANVDNVALATQSKLLTQVSTMLAIRHYSPRTINDDFSKAVWERYINRLDAKREFFLQKDIDSLKKYELTIDDEIHGVLPVSFLPCINRIYNREIDLCIQEYAGLLMAAFDFNKEEKPLSAIPDRTFPASDKARIEKSRERLKYQTLQAFVSLQEQQSSAKKGDTLYGRSNAELEDIARKATAKNAMLRLTRLKAMAGEEKQFAVFVSTLVNYMDPHSEYLPPADTRGYQESVSNKFFGTGARMLEKDGFVYINDMEPGSPALKSGQIQIGDIIVAVGQSANGEMVDVGAMPPAEIAKLVRGEKGTAVRLLLRKADGSLKTVLITRGEIIPEDGRVRIALIEDGTKKIGYILLPGFYDDPKDANGPHCARDVAAALKTLVANDIAGVVMDLRNNGGGSFREAVSMIKLFVSSGPVVQTKDRNENAVPVDDPRTSQLYRGPLVVMVNELSASASEIFAAAIQDDHRGVIIGSASTFGKGSSQGAFPIGANTQNGILKITMQKFYRLSGGATQLKGVKADIVLPDIYGYQKLREEDNTDALPWDTVAAAKYVPEKFFELKKIQAMADDRIKEDAVFKALERNINWLTKNRDVDLPLDIASFKLLNNKRQQVAKMNEALLKLQVSKQLEVIIPGIASTGLNVRNQQMLSKISADIYVDQAVKVIADLIKTPILH
ncbi:carboxy terminal-processing peptidase [Mucilaginibacter jinjuensis]|uniref:Carboxy terminal-processing peptidase n=1 Tax=Mucilaginibacter jinjuensis TaxID=1176721 RepID=A0ABY7TA73_9SPHI|nr:carboxy terminal-processing peptidase [Mucilaginibacter jinjuensis]WCT13409.1 carboxy terminal-processing peptidase [Mucilaginibacter jinjuensis]